MIMAVTNLVAKSAIHDFIDPDQYHFLICLNVQGIPVA